jgi:hypothetical protein
MLIGFSLDGEVGGDGEVDEPLLCHVLFVAAFLKTIDIGTIPYYNTLRKSSFSNKRMITTKITRKVWR